MVEVGSRAERDHIGAYDDSPKGNNLGSPTKFLKKPLNWRFFLCLKYELKNLGVRAERSETTSKPTTIARRGIICLVLPEFERASRMRGLLLSTTFSASLDLLPFLLSLGKSRNYFLRNLSEQYSFPFIGF